MSDLLPCPFCGLTDPLSVHPLDDEYPEYWVHCYQCGIDGPDGPTEADAIASWNRRPREVSG